MPLQFKVLSQFSETNECFSHMRKRIYGRRDGRNWVIFFYRDLCINLGFDAVVKNGDEASYLCADVIGGKKLDHEVKLKVDR